MADSEDNGYSLDEKEIVKCFKEHLKASIEGRRVTMREGKDSRKFYDGHQWSNTDESALKAQNRAPVVINKIARVVNVVLGMEILNRSEPKYIPRTTDSNQPIPGSDDTSKNEIATEASRYFRYQSNADAEDQQAFSELVIESIGCTNTRLDFEDDPDGAVVIERVDPERVYWDVTAEKANLIDGRYVICRKVLSREEIKDRWPGKYEEVKASIQADSYSGEGGKDAPPSADYDRDLQPDSVLIRKSKCNVYEYQFYRLEKYFQWEDPSRPGEISELSADEHAAQVKKIGDNLSLVNAAIQKSQLSPEMTATAPPELIAEMAAETQRQTMLQETLADVEARLSAAVQRTRKVYYQAFIAGEKLLEPVSLLPSQCGFTYQFMTGYWDKTEQCFYGLVRAMKDPQSWFNKTISREIDILQTTPLAGYIVEEGAQGDAREFEDSIARNDMITYVPRGSVTSGAIQPKQPAQLSAVLAQLMQVAQGSVELVSGVNPEMMGQGGANTPVGTTYSRNRQGYTMLAFFFDRLALYRRNQGRVQLELMRKLPSRLIRRVTGTMFENDWVEFSGERLAPRYDVIVDQAPSSPNQQQESFEVLQTVLMPLFKAMGLPPQALAPMIDDLPGLRASVKYHLKQLLSMAPQGAVVPNPNPPPPGQQMGVPTNGSNGEMPNPYEGI